MRINQLQACAITGFSLADITPEPLAISVPLMIGSPAELDYVMGKVQTRFEQALLINRRAIAFGPANEVFSPESISEAFGGRVLYVGGVAVVDDCCDHEHEHEHAAEPGE